jgi:hypothetical protein
LLKAFVDEEVEIIKGHLEGVKGLQALVLLGRIKVLDNCITVAIQDVLGIVH